MPKVYELLVGVAQQRFWPLLTGSLLLFVAGTFLWYSADSSEIYFKNYQIQQYIPVPRPALPQMPWWQFDLVPGDTLLMPLRLPAKTPDGQWFIEVLGHPIDSRAGGAISVNGQRLEVDASLGPRWQRIHLDARPETGDSYYALRYHALDPTDAGARFRLWGTYSQSKPLRRPKLVSEGRAYPLPLPEPLPFRRGNLAPKHESKWQRAYESLSTDPFFRVGVKTQLVSRRWIGDKLILISVGLLAGLLVLCFAAFTIQHPVSGLAVLVISLTALWLRFSAIGSLTDQYERTLNGLTIRNNLWWDSGGYFTLAFRVFSNETRPSLNWPIGMPTFSAYLFQWSGLHLGVPKYGFAFLQTMVGPALFFACRRLVRFEILPFLPLLLWSAFLRPIKYSYYYLSESLAMCLMIAWIAILISRDPRNRLPDWPWVVVSSSVLFVLSGYSRDLIITFLPVFVGMIWIFAGGRQHHRLTSAAGALAVVVALWCASPVLFSNKSFSGGLAHFLAITPSHYLGAQKAAAGKGASDASILGTLGESLDELLDSPRAYLGDVYSDAERFWNPRYRWANRADFSTSKDAVEIKGVHNVRAAYENSVPARYLLNDNPGGTYGLLLKLAMVTAVFGLIFSPRWSVLAGLLAYVTLFQVLLYPSFTARPKAIFFPVIVLFASLGVFAAIEQFPAWLRATVVRRRRLFVR